MRDEMKKGDMVLFYHSNAKPPGVAGIATVCKEGYPDPTAFDKKSKYFAPKSKKEAPTWILVDVAFVEKFKSIIPLQDLRDTKSLEGLMVTAKGSRLSIQPVSKKHFEIIRKMGRSKKD
jgi:predicted RNA-binding protein with PUA-like domain